MRCKYNGVCEECRKLSGWEHSDGASDARSPPEASEVTKRERCACRDGFFRVAVRRMSQALAGLVIGHSHDALSS